MACGQTAEDQAALCRLLRHPGFHRPTFLLVLIKTGGNWLFWAQFFVLYHKWTLKYLKRFEGQGFPAAHAPFLMGRDWCMMATEKRINEFVERADAGIYKLSQEVLIAFISMWLVNYARGMIAAPSVTKDRVWNVPEATFPATVILCPTALVINSNDA